jgi:hypothetical protein
LVPDIKEGTKTEGIKNRVQRRISGPKADETIGGWRKLHNEVFHNLYSSSNRMVRSRRMGREGHVARMWEKRNTYRFLVGKPEESRQLGKRRRRW